MASFVDSVPKEVPASALDKVGACVVAKPYCGDVAAMASPVVPVPACSDDEYVRELVTAALATKAKSDSGTAAEADTDTQAAAETDAGAGTDMDANAGTEAQESAVATDAVATEGGSGAEEGGDALGALHTSEAAEVAEPASVDAPASGNHGSAPCASCGTDTILVTAALSRKTQEVESANSELSKQLSALQAALNDKQTQLKRIEALEKGMAEFAASRAPEVERFTASAAVATAPAAVPNEGAPQAPVSAPVSAPAVPFSGGILFTDYASLAKAVGSMGAGFASAPTPVPSPVAVAAPKPAPVHKRVSAAVNSLNEQAAKVLGTSGASAKRGVDLITASAASKPKPAAPVANKRACLSEAEMRLQRSLKVLDEVFK